MKLLFFITALLSANVYAQAENEPVTNKQFQEHQKKQKQIEKQKAKKTPYLLPSSAFNTKAQARKRLGEKYRVMVIGDRVMNYRGGPKACGFHYIKVADQGFGKQAGQGYYYFESKGGTGCRRAGSIKGQDVSSVTLTVQMSGLTVFANRMGERKIIPVLDIVDIE